MATAFAQQLRQIAAKSTNELDLKAQRAAHAESLLFERDVAVKQDWETLYELCHEGFRELCLLDSRLKEFERNLFAPHSQDQDREQLNKTQNEALDSVIEQCLELLCASLALRPGVKTLEWLIRRFRIHVYNTGILLLTLLPYHETQLFQNVLSLIPATQIADEWKFLRPYHQHPSIIPRHTIVYTATTNEGFFIALNHYATESCRNGSSNVVYMKFWSAVVVEAVTARLKQARSGRSEIQRQRSEDCFLRVIPLINDGLTPASPPEMIVTSFTLSLIIASTGLLEDNVIDSLMLAITSALRHPSVDIEQALMCLAILATQKGEHVIHAQIIDMIAGVENVVARLENVKRQYPIGRFLYSMVQGVLRASSGSGGHKRIALLDSLGHHLSSLCDEVELAQVLVALVTCLHRQDATRSIPMQTFFKLKSVLQTAYDNGNTPVVVAELQKLCAKQGLEFEGILETTVPEGDLVLRLQDEMDIETNLASQTELEAAIQTLLDRSPAGTPFLVDPASSLSNFNETAKIFSMILEKENNPFKFKDLAIWKAGTASKSRYLSFLLRLACGSHQQQHRAAAIELLNNFVTHNPSYEVQNLLAFTTILLADEEAVVRHQAAALVMSIHRASLATDQTTQIGLELYRDESSVETAGKLAKKTLSKILELVYLPSIEECIADSRHMHRVLVQALVGGGSQTSSAQPNAEIKKSLRYALFECLTGEAKRTTLLRVKTSTIRLLDGVAKVAGLTLFETLKEVLVQWLNRNLEAALRDSQTEEIQLSAVDEGLTLLVTSRETQVLIDTLDHLQQMASPPRAELVSALFSRLATTWTSQKTEGETRVALELFNMSFLDHELLAREARATLRKVPLSTNALLKVLQTSFAGIEAQAGPTSPPKRRKTSHKDSGVRESDQLAASSQSFPRIVLALELVDSSTTALSVELLPLLFDVLVVVRRSKSSLQSDSPYLLGLCLHSLLAIIERMKLSSRHRLDSTSIRADIVVDCVRGADNPQVQSDALLLTASLAEIAPEQVIHHVMPVFTFMGSSLLSLNDGHSVNVINQAIDRIIPPLVSTLKQQNRTNLIRSTTSLLSTFVTAFDHIPPQRRIGLYQRLLQRLGAEDFGFALAALLQTSQQSKANRENFIVEVMAGFATMDHLASYSKILSLVTDIYSDKPHDADSLLHIDSSSSPLDRLHMSLSLFSLAEALSNSKSLRSRLAKSSTTDEMESQLSACLYQLLQIMQTLKPYGRELINAVSKCLTAFLTLLPLSQLIRMLPGLLQQIDQTDAMLKPQALHVLAAQMQAKVPNDPDAASRTLSYLSELGKMLQSGESDQLKEAAIACIDRILEKYGRKDLDAVLRAAGVLISDAGLASNNPSLQLRSALVLSSILDMMGEAGVPIVPQVMANVQRLVVQSFDEGSENVQLHDAGFALTSSVVSNIPFMLSEDHLDQILTMAAEASFSDLPARTKIARQDMFSIVAQRIELPSLISSLGRVWEGITSNDIDAVLPTLDMAITAVEHHSKSTVMKCADAISSLILQVLDLRRVQFTNRNDESYSDEEVDQVEQKLTDLTLKFIYKINDSAFRPIFESWIDWAVQCHDIPGTSSEEMTAKAKTFRQTSLFTLLTTFFDNLKSIVTSYAGYIIHPANAILRVYASLAKEQASLQHFTTPTSLTLYSTLSTLLSTTLTHDSASFFTSPSHFSPLSTILLSQLNLAHLKPFRPLTQTHIIPTIVALATAVQDTPAHHMSINHHLAQLRHSENAKVRLASIQTHIAITSSEDAGEEWVHNVVSGSGTIDATTDADADADADADVDVDMEHDGEVAAKKSTATVGGAGETMIYVNEMLEDDDEDVEKEVRRWVGMVRGMVGEDVFEF